MKRTGRNLTLVALGLASTVALAGGSAHANSSASAAHQPDALHRCTTAQLNVVVGTSDAGAGHVGLKMRFHNHSARACTLYGYPGAQLLAGSGQPLMTHVERGAGYLSGPKAKHLVRVAPGGNAYFAFEWTHIPSPGQTCPHAPALRITPPNAYRSIHVSLHSSLYGNFIDACGGVIHVTPVEPNNFSF